MDTTLNLFDLIFIIGLVSFVVLAFFRGFVREVFSLLNWAISIFATIFLSDLLAILLKSFLQDPFVINIVSLIASFIVVFIVSTILTRRLASIVKEKIPYSTDQFLGLAYGFLKAFLVFGLVYAFIINTHGIIFKSAMSKAKYKDSMPSWLYNSKFRSVISPFGNTLDPVVKMIIGKASPRFEFKKKESSLLDLPALPGKIIDKINSKNVNKLEPYGIYNKNKKIVDEKIEKQGYNKRELKKMDNLINNIE